jgi:hypothetical protein
MHFWGTLVIWSTSFQPSYFVICVINVVRMTFVGTGKLPGPAPAQQRWQIGHSLPFLESSNEVPYDFTA